MRIFRLLSLILSVCLLCGAAAAVRAEAFEGYELGYTVEGLSFAMLDGSTVFLDSLLQEKKAVLINLFASWCVPCREELPHLQAVCDELSDGIAVLCMSAYEDDDLQALEAIWREEGLTLPLGYQPELYEIMDGAGYPHFVLIDRSGVICYSCPGAFPSADVLRDLFVPFLEADYDEPHLIWNMEEIVQPYRGEMPDAQALAAALGLNGNIAVVPAEDPFLWPFLPEDGCAAAANGQAKGANAALALRVTAQTGDMLVFDYASDAVMSDGCLFVALDDPDDLRAVYGGRTDWTTAALPLEPGENTVHFICDNGLYANGPVEMRLRRVRVLPQEEAEALVPPSVFVRSLPEYDFLIEPASENARMLRQEYDGEFPGPDEYVVTGEGEVMLRARIGEYIDPALSYVVTGEKSYPLLSLPADELGYLFPTDASSLISTPHGFDFFAACLYPDAFPGDDFDTAVLFGYPDVENALLSMEVNAALAVEDGMTFLYSYADGTPFVPQGEAAAQPSAPAVYDIYVVDAQGAPIAGAMVQICTDELCQVAFTDEQGCVSHTADPYPYEIHILKAKGFEKHDTLYTMPIEGGTLVIELTAQP